MSSLIKRFVREEEGASLVEYGLLVGLIAVVCILVVTALGEKIWGVFDTTQQAVDSDKMVSKAASDGTASGT